METEHSEKIKLISSDGVEFCVDKKYALASGTIRNLLNGPALFAESVRKEIPFREISSRILQKIVEYMEYKIKYTDATDDIPEFVIEPEIALELLMAANFLDL